jgi:hypothetical protein
VSPLLAVAHYLFDQAHDQYDNRATGATSGDLTDDGAKVESTSGRAREGRDSHAKKLPTDATAYDPGNGISDRAQTSQSTFPLPVPCATPGAGRHAHDCKSRTPGNTRRTDAA